MTDLEIIQQYIQKNIKDVDLEVVSKESQGGKALFRASIDNVEGGNYCTSGWEYTIDEAFHELAEELKKMNTTRLTEKLTNK
jgi:uncharacterized protein (UPF0128 family)